MASVSTKKLCNVEKIFDEACSVTAHGGQLIVDADWIAGNREVSAAPATLLESTVSLREEARAGRARFLLIAVRARARI